MYFDKYTYRVLPKVYVIDSLFLFVSFALMDSVEVWEGPDPEDPVLSSRGKKLSVRADPHNLLKRTVAAAAKIGLDVLQVLHT